MTRAPSAALLEPCLEMLHLWLDPGRASAFYLPVTASLIQLSSPFLSLCQDIYRHPSVASDLGMTGSARTSAAPLVKRCKRPRIGTLPGRSPCERSHVPRKFQLDHASDVSKFCSNEPAARKSPWLCVCRPHGDYTLAVEHFRPISSRRASRCSSKTGSCSSRRSWALGATFAVHVQQHESRTPMHVILAV